MRIKFDTESIRFINLFESVTGARVKDCILDNNKNKILFIIKRGQAGLAIGKNGTNVKKVEKMINKQVEVLEFSNDPIEFVVNIFRPIKIKDAYISEKSNGEKVLHISLADENLGIIRTKMKVAKSLITRYFNINEIIYGR